MFVQVVGTFIHWKYTFIHIYLIQPPNIRQFSIIQDFTASWQMKNEHMAEIYKSFIIKINISCFSKSSCSLPNYIVLHSFNDLFTHGAVKGWIVENITIAVIDIYKISFFQTCILTASPKPKHTNKQTNCRKMLRNMKCLYLWWLISKFPPYAHFSSVRKL